MELRKMICDWKFIETKIWWQNCWIRFIWCGFQYYINCLNINLKFVCLNAVINIDRFITRMWTKFDMFKCFSFFSLCWIQRNSLSSIKQRYDFKRSVSVLIHLNLFVNLIFLHTKSLKEFYQYSFHHKISTEKLKISLHESIFLRDEW
jgi:hypothetical protein